MPYILFPNVPNVPGVPNILRPVETAIASNPVIAVAVGTFSSILSASLQQQQTQWGIFDQSGRQLGASSTVGFGDVLSAQLTGDPGSLVSTVEFAFRRESKVADYQLEKGSFYNYNKVMRPGTTSVVLAVSGTKQDRSNFIAELDAACASTDLYNVVTPEVTYTNYNIQDYNFARRSSQGQTLLVFDISLTEIREVSSSYTKNASLITSPKLPSSVSPVDAGKVQAAAPDTSTLKSIFTKLGIN